MFYIFYLAIFLYFNKSIVALPTLPKNGYKSIIERVEVFNYNEIEIIDINLFWYNRTMKATNITIIFNEDCCGSMDKVAVNTYEFLNNEYRPYAVRLEKNKCEFIKFDYKLFFYQDLMRTEGSKFYPPSCPIKKGIYSSYYYIPLNSRLSDLPLNKFKVEILNYSGQNLVWKAAFYMVFDRDVHFSGKWK